MNLDNGLIRRAVDGKSAIIEFADGCSLVVHHFDKPQWVACAVPESMSDAIRARKGDISIVECRDDDDVAIIVTIGRDTLAYCSTPESQRFLVRRPKLLFTS